MNTDSSTEVAAATPRKRRTRVEARNAILEVAERRLAQVGLSGLKLQEIAGELGISHPAILHHFGSRERLVEEVIERAMENLAKEVVAVLSRTEPAAGQFRALIADAFATLSETDNARVLAWMLLGRPDLMGPEGMLHGVAEAAKKRLDNEGGAETSYEELLFAITLIVTSALGVGLMDGKLYKSSGAPEEEVAVRYRDWLTKLIVSHFDRMLTAK